MAVSSHGAGALSRLRAEQPHLTPALRRLAEVVLASPQEVIYQSVTELAELAEVGEASVIRLCRDLGFKGFQDLSWHSPPTSRVLRRRIRAQGRSST